MTYNANIHAVFEWHAARVIAGRNASESGRASARLMVASLRRMRAARAATVDPEPLNRAIER